MKCFSRERVKSWLGERTHNREGWSLWPGKLKRGSRHVTSRSPRPLARRSCLCFAPTIPPPPPPNSVYPYPHPHPRTPVRASQFSLDDKETRTQHWPQWATLQCRKTPGLRRGPATDSQIHQCHQARRMGTILERRRIRRRRAVRRRYDTLKRIKTLWFTNKRKQNKQQQNLSTR